MDGFLSVFVLDLPAEVVGAVVGEGEMPGSDGPFWGGGSDIVGIVWDGDVGVSVHVDDWGF